MLLLVVSETSAVTLFNVSPNKFTQLQKLKTREHRPNNRTVVHTSLKFMGSCKTQSRAQTTSLIFGEYSSSEMKIFLYTFQISFIACCTTSGPVKEKQIIETGRVSLQNPLKQIGFEFTTNRKHEPSAKTRIVSCLQWNLQETKYLNVALEHGAFQLLLKFYFGVENGNGFFNLGIF